MRLFFAIALPGDLIAGVEAVQARLRATVGDNGVRWARSDQYHYTLKFLGEQAFTGAEKAVEAAHAARTGQAAFDLTLGGIGAFPSNQRPSVLWLGALAGGDEVTAIAERLDQALAARHFPRERRPLQAHLTLARVRSYAGEIAASQALAKAATEPVGTARIDRFVLMRSVLKPSGSEYTVVDEFPLGP